MIKRAFVGVLVLASLFSMSVVPASALTVGEVQAQIQSLLSQLSAWGASPAQSTTVVASPSYTHRVCGFLSRNLSFGMRGEDVLALQEFLRAEGYLSTNATGYFGPATRAALARWQASQGISSVGIVGPITRARIAAWCGFSTPALPSTPSPTPTPSPDPSSDPRCKSWYDGCNDCSRQYPGAPAMCTLRACLTGQGFWQAPAYCKEYFDGGANRPPVVSGFSGPTTLSINQSGTWSVQASDPENGPLSYSITWGDEMYATPMASYAAESFVQTTTFTHAYARAGAFSVIVHVRDSSGQQAQTTTTVRVEGTVGYCTMEYAPVCGQPPEPACRYTQPYCMLPTPAPQTYGNRCMLNAAGATFLYNGQCGAVTY